MRAAASARVQTLSFISSTSALLGTSRARSDCQGRGVAAHIDHRVGSRVRPHGHPQAGGGAAPAVLIIGGAGGVSSIAIQLVRALTDLTVVATASRPETRSWVKDLGAHHVIDHGKPIAEQVAALGIGAREFVFSTTHTADHLKEIVELIAPQGRLALINNSR